MSESTLQSQPQKRPASPIAGVDYPPKFESVTEERRERKRKLTAALRLFGRLGFDEGVAGHFTVRDPEHTDQFWVNPFGRSFKQMRVSDLILVNHDGDIVQGSGRLNAAAFAIHSQIHKHLP
ncbi:class II aldolase/adducin family protein, partial [Pseudomonadales bacterium]|nr:class II aldolase/adducin family protein [Pseudomonadales bacterium]